MNMRTDNKLLATVRHRHAKAITYKRRMETARQNLIFIVTTACAILAMFIIFMSN